MSKCSHILKYEGLRLQCINFGETVQPTAPVLLFPQFSRSVCDVSKRKVLSVRILPEEPKGLGKFLEGVRLKHLEVCT